MVEDEILFLKQVSNRMKLKPVILSSALIYYRRFQQKGSSFSAPITSRDVALACIFLACKVEESIPSVRRLLDEAHKVQDPSSALALSAQPEMFAQAQTTLLSAEKLVLTSMSFNLVVEHAQPYAVEFLHPLCKELNLPPSRIQQLAFQFLLDFLSQSETYILYSPKLLAAGAVSLAIQYELFASTNQHSTKTYTFPDIKSDHVKIMESVFVKFI